MRTYTFWPPIIITFILLLPGLSVAAERTPLEKDYGRSLNTAKAAQILNPSAGENNDAPMGLGGGVGDRVMNSYYGLFEAAAPTVTNVFNIGLGGEGGQ